MKDTREESITCSVFGSDVSPWKDLPLFDGIIVSKSDWYWTIGDDNVLDSSFNQVFGKTDWIFFFVERVLGFKDIALEEVDLGEVRNKAGDFIRGDSLD